MGIEIIARTNLLNETVQIILYKLPPPKFFLGIPDGSVKLSLEQISLVVALLYPECKRVVRF